MGAITSGRESRRFVPPEAMMTPTQGELSTDRESTEPLRQEFRDRHMFKADTDMYAHRVEIDVLDRTTGRTKKLKLRKYLLTPGEPEGPNTEYGYQAMIGLDLVNYKGDKDEQDIARRLWEKYAPQVDRAAAAFEADELKVATAQHGVNKEAHDYAERTDDQYEMLRIEALDLLVDDPPESE